MDSFYDEIKNLPLGEPVSEQSENFENGGTGIKQQKKRKLSLIGRKLLACDLGGIDMTAGVCTAIERL
uniref:Something about silencing protein sas10 n=1 Tax=Solanum tuberosum TaxID=4113 RepID=M1AJN1_SOLTU